MEVKHHFYEPPTIKASKVSFLVFWRVLNSNQGCKTMNTKLEVTEVTYVKKNGGQSDLSFDNFDVGCNIVEWGVIFEGIHASGLKSEFKKCSVSDPDRDPDPVGSGYFDRLGSGSGSGLNTRIPDPGSGSTISRRYN